MITPNTEEASQNPIAIQPMDSPQESSFFPWRCSIQAKANSPGLDVIKNLVKCVLIAIGGFIVGGLLGAGIGCVAAGPVGAPIGFLIGAIIGASVGFLGKAAWTVGENYKLTLQKNS